MDHSDLIRELPQIEQMTNQERLKLAQNRRKQQLKQWTQREKAILGKGNRTLLLQQDRKSLNGKSKSARVRFRESTMLLEAAGRNDIDEVRRLLENGVSPNKSNEDGLTSLHQCCIDDNEEMLKLLLDFGVNVNSEDSEKWTPLHAAATCGHLHLCKKLIAKGANLLAVNAEGNMPYDICDDEKTLEFLETEMSKRGVTQELIEDIRGLPETRMLRDMENILSTNGDLTFRDPKDGATYLHIASANGYNRVVEFLLENHIAVDAQDNDYWQPIHAAACWNHIEVLELLVQNGADLNARTKNNETPYAICEDPEIKERIIQIRSEQETRNGTVKKVKRSQSSNSRTQSIRRTSQRDRGLSSKKDVADEAQKRFVVTENSLKDNDSSPTLDWINSDTGNENIAIVTPLRQNDYDSNSSCDETEDDGVLKSLPPAFMMGRDSITQLHSIEDGFGNRRDIKRQRLVSSPLNSGDLDSNGSKTNKLYNNNVHYDKSSFSSPLAVPKLNNIDIGDNLPTPEVNPIIELQPQVTSAAANDNLTTGNGTIDIRVQVTINTSTSNSSPTCQSFGYDSQNYSFGKTNSNASIYSSPPGTLADLKKQRSLQYSNSSNRLMSSFVSQQQIPLEIELRKQPEVPSSPSLSLKRFTGNPGDLIGDYSNERKKCCIIV